MANVKNKVINPTRINSIEKDIFQILKLRSRDMNESVMILSHLLYCAGSSLNVDTDVLFSKLSSQYKNQYDKEKVVKLKF